MSRARALLPVCVAGALLGAAALPAARADEPPPSVKISGIKDPEMRSYRSIAAGFDAFDEHRALAPAATLRFHMMRKEGGSASAADGLVLALAGDADSVTVPIGPDGVFALARSQAAWDADASFILNRKSGLFIAHPEVRSPGLPAQVRRLGDLRLECRVTVAIVKQQIPLLARAAINTMLMTGDWCAKKDLRFGYPSATRVNGATLRDGARALPLEVDDWQFSVPIGDASWPDDALVELSVD
jgi:hypothetical protein